MSTPPESSSMSSLMNDQGILSDAESNDVPGTDTLTNCSQIEEEWMDHSGSEYECDDEWVTRPCSPLRAGALPLELWWGIFKIIDDPRALLACGYTCVAFRDAVRRVVYGRAAQWIDRGMAKMQLAADPTGGYFFERLWFWSHCFLSWMSTFPIPSPRLRFLWISGPQTLQTTTHTLSLRFQTRLALSRLTTITHLELSHVHFSSFSDFARMVCALPNLATLKLDGVIVDDRGSSALQGAYFARDLRLKKLEIRNCAFGESHPIWNLLTAPSLSDSLKHIDIKSYATDSQRALQEIIVPSVELFSPNLVQLTTLRLLGWNLSCGDIRNTVCRNALSRSPAGLITTIEIDYCCDHAPPHLNEWRSLFSALDDTVTAGEFSCLRTITVSFWADHPLDVDSVRTLLSSQSHSSKWTAAFAMSSMVFEPETVHETHSVSLEGSQKTEVVAEECIEGITLCIVMGYPYGSYKVTVRYTPRQST
ncbi:hypothetical protein CERSUDRAFT_109814 [Gelatoporia subvermispora B]|uniref:F-box domain-containing protein n=1 Tax=Ceriporiopsis subvermispora (strain B) TaxID=914234 RepID=M2QVQ7_CERS8|nr:hypothetical protein CERSUDRAFT_109814 [Gelatoporia subvermispora B]